MYVQYVCTCVCVCVCVYNTGRGSKRAKILTTGEPG